MHGKEICHLQIPSTSSASKIITRYGLQSSLLFLVLFLVGFMSAPQCFAVPTVSWTGGTHFLGDSGIGGSPTIITVNDSAANTPSLDHILVHVTSTSDPVGVSLNLTESGGSSTGIFKNTNFIFYTGDGLIPIGRTVTVSISDPDENTHPTTIDTLRVLAQSTSDIAGLSLNFSETGINTGIFSGKITFATVSGSSGSTLNVHAGDEVSIRDTISSLNANALITPNPDAGFGAILAKIGDTVTVTYQGISADILIGNDTHHSGGGGGGLIAHPGLVLDALIGLVGGSPYVVSPPSFGGRDYHFSDGLTLTQGDNKTVFDISHYNQEIPRQVMVAGEQVHMTFKTFESYYSEGVIHMGLYFIPRGQDMQTTNSIAFIEWQKGEPVKLMDPMHILHNASATSNSDGKFQYTQFSFTPSKSYDKMSFLVRTWNDHLYTTDVRVHDAVEVPPSFKTLAAGVIRYDDIADLQEKLQREQFYKPEIMAHIHDTSSVFPDQNGNVYWLYDTMDHSVTLVISDANDNEVYSYKSLLQPYAIEKKGDYKFMYFTVKQLSRWDTDQMQKAMKSEEERAMSVGLEKRIMPQSKW